MLARKHQGSPRSDPPLPLAAGVVPPSADAQSSRREEWQHVEFLQRESHGLAVTTQGLQAHLIAVMLGSFTVLTATAIGLAQFDKYEILLVVPAVLPLAWLSGVRLLAELYVCAAQRRAIENEMWAALRRLDAEAGFRPWESMAGPSITRSASNLAFYAWFSVFSAVLGVSCIGAAWAHGSDRTFLWLAVATFVAGGSLAIAGGVGAVRLFLRFPETFPGSARVEP